MKRKIISCFLAIIMVAFVLPFAAFATEKDINLKMAVISDLHVLPKELIKNTDDYNQYLNSDLKLISESEAILNAAIDEIKKTDIDVLLIPGDLSCNGEYVSHELVSAKLAQLKKDMPGLTILVINGNHDINKKGQNFNTENGKAVSVKSTSVAEFKELYSFCYGDEHIIAQYGDDNLSYVARIGGYSFIVIDSNKYGHTGGKINSELLSWIEYQSNEAKKRGDALIAMMHHGIVPHTTIQPIALSDYLVDDYLSIANTFANLGIGMVFTGHIHSNDIACMTTLKGNTIYDISTGSMVVYPSPIRFVNMTKTNESVNAEFTCKTGITVPEFINPYTGEVQIISNLTEYGLSRGYNEDSVQILATELIEDVVRNYLTSNDSDAQWMLNKIQPKLNTIVYRVCDLEIDSTHTTLDAVNYIFFINYAGLDNGQYPDWVNTGIKNLSNGKLISQIMDIIRQEAFSDLKSKIRFNFHSTLITNRLIGKAAVLAINSLGNDSNFREDNETTITLDITPNA